MEIGNDLHILTRYRSPDLSADRASHYHISVFNSPGRVQIAVLDVVLNRYLALTEFSQEENALTLSARLTEAEPLLKEPVKRIQLSLTSPVFTLVPGTFFDTTSAEKYLGLMHNAYQPGMPVYHDRLRNFDIRNIYSLHASLLHKPGAAGTDVLHSHHLSALLDILHMHFRTAATVQVFAHLHGIYTDIVILHGRQLRFCNTFHTPQPHDVLYHILLAMEQNNLSASDQELVLLGDISKQDELFSEIKKQVPRTALLKVKPVFTLAPELHEVSLSRYFLLLQQYRTI